jgi:hypothetical protein
MSPRADARPDGLRLTTAISDAKNGRSPGSSYWPRTIAMIGSGGFGFLVDLRTLVIVAVIAIAAIAWFVIRRRSTKPRP